MANPIKGEASFDLDGASYTLVYDIEAFIAVEDATDKSISDILAEIGSGKTPKIGTMRVLVWAGFRDRHPEITLKEAGDMLFSSGAVVPEAMKKGLGNAFPQSAPEEKGKNPPKARAGTGKIS